MLSIFNFFKRLQPQISKESALVLITFVVETLSRIYKLTLLIVVCSTHILVPNVLLSFLIWLACNYLNYCKFVCSWIVNLFLSIHHLKNFFWESICRNKFFNAGIPLTFVHYIFKIWEFLDVALCNHNFKFINVV